MMRRRRRRSFGPKWTYSNSQTLLVNAATGHTSPGGLVCDFCWLLPPARAQFLMNTKQRDRMQFSGAHIWLDFYWRNEGAQTGIPDVSFGAYRSNVIDPTGLPDFTTMDGQWKEPATPGSLTAWDEDDDDGTNPFLWQHWIKGSSPCNSLVATSGTPGEGNQLIVIPAGTVDSQVHVCRKEYVVQEWQPDVVVRSKRRIQKGEGVVLVMAVTTPSAQVSSILNVHYRTLTK